MAFGECCVAALLKYRSVPEAMGRTLLQTITVTCRERFLYGAPGRNRTGDLALRRHSLYPLSYRGLRFRAGGASGPEIVVEEKGIEPSTFALRTRRSPN